MWDQNFHFMQLEKLSPFRTFPSTCLHPPCNHTTLLMPVQLLSHNFTKFFSIKQLPSLFSCICTAAYSHHPPLRLLLQKYIPFLQNVSSISLPVLDVHKFGCYLQTWNVSSSRLCKFSRKPRSRETSPEPCSGAHYYNKGSLITSFFQWVCHCLQESHLLIPIT